MMRILRSRFGILLAGLAPVLGGGWGTATAAADPAPSDSTVTAAVTYVAGSSIYVDAGAEAGLTVGAPGTVERGGKTIATVTVTYLSPRRASCTLASSTVIPQPGDVARIRRAPGGTPVPSPPAVVPGPTAAGAPLSPRSEGSWFRRNGLRGRLGVRYLALHDQQPDGESFTQPAFDVSLRGTAIGGGAFDLLADVRQRHTIRSLAAGGSVTDSRTRVYALNGAWHAAPSFQLTLGRQISGNLPSVGTFDGALAALPGAGFEAGAFAGTQPDPVSYGVSGDVLEFGGFGRVKGGAPRGLRRSLTAGVIASTSHGTVNRDYLYVNGQILHPRFFAYGLQEIDYNPGWKAAAEGKRWSATSSYLSVRFRAASPLDLRASFDNRRNVRLYRDRDTPETQFDDSYRRGVSGGADLRLARRFRVGGSIQSSRSPSAGSADAYTLTLGANRVSLLHVDLSSRHTRYLGPLVSGWLHSVSAGISPETWLDLSGHVGIRDERQHTPGAVGQNTHWYGADADVGLRRDWYLLLSFEAVRGDDERTNQVYSSLSYRF